MTARQFFLLTEQYIEAEKEMERKKTISSHNQVVELRKQLEAEIARANLIMRSREPEQKNLFG